MSDFAKYSDQPTGQPRKQGRATWVASQEGFIPRIRNPSPAIILLTTLRLILKA